jgi:hypothetical protein
VDGRLDEADWQSALRVELPFEVNPGENLPASARTEALLLYGDDQLSVAFRVSDPRPAEIRARYTDRDTAFQDDFVGIVVDTFNDQRRAYEFFVNALGVQMDLIVDDVNGSEDSSWDGIWESAGALTADGYVVEIGIPYRSISFQQGQSDQTWGFDLVRIYPRDRRFLFASNPRDRNVNCYLCQIGTLVGFDGATPGKNLEVAPTMTARRTDRRDPFPQGALASGDADYDPGLTIRWGITPNLSLGGAVNPDFSQVEADVAQLDVNEQFALFFPEKRPFFLEGSDFFATPMQAVYSRTVADPSWGAKLTGKAGRNVLGAIFSQDDITNLLFPGSQGSSSESIDQEASIGILRHRLDLGSNSSLGFLFTGRSGDDYLNGVLGVDGMFRPRAPDTIRFQALGSRTRYPDALAQSFGQPQDDFNGAALKLNYTHYERDGGFWLDHVEIGRDFRADLGFIPQVDISRPLVGGERVWRGDPGEALSRLILGGDFDQTKDQDGRLIERELEGWFIIQGPKQLYLRLGPGYRLRGFRDALFDQGFVNLYAELLPAAWITLGVDAGYSKRVDFAFEDPADTGAARQGDEFRAAPFVRLEPGRHLRLVLTHNWRTLGIDRGSLFRANLTELRATYQVGLRAFFRAIVQYSDVTRNVGLYPACADPSLGLTCDLTPEERDLFTQLLFSYKINPQTALYVGYSDSQAAIDDPAAGLFDTGLKRASRTFFLKVGRAWSF